MSKYTFIHTPDIAGLPTVTVEFDDTGYPFIEDVLSAFDQFLQGVTFQRKTIDKYLDIEKVNSVRVDNALRVEELRKDMANAKRNSK